jgi:hypothetical protein
MEINWIGEILDTIANISGKYGQWLNAHKKRVCFIVWIVCCSYWIIRTNIFLHSINNFAYIWVYKMEKIIWRG